MPPRRQSSAPVDHPEDALGLKPRLAAIILLQAALARRNGFEEASAARAFLDLPVRDRAFARALTLATLRHLGPIERLLQSRLQKPPPEAVMSLLRIGLAQVLHLEVADFAAVSTTVALAEARPVSRPFKGLVNAVLRSVLRDPPPASAPEHGAPPWLYSRWRAAYGEAAYAIAARIAEEPPTDLTPRRAEDAEALAAQLDAVLLPGGTLRTRRRGELSAWPGFTEGCWWVQDAAAAIPARLLDVRPSQTALDLCAAPGGKTLQLAAAGAAVTAVDRSATRLRRLSENLARMGLTAEIVAADAASWSDERVFDAVLLDAPCSATGTFRRHPDVLWAAKPGDIAKLAAVQGVMLDAAAGRVRPGGALVYCVCSLEPEEGEAQASAFLRRHPGFRLDPPRPGEGGAPAEALTPDGWLRITPGLAEPAGGLDGFFIAKFRKGD